MTLDPRHDLLVNVLRQAGHTRAADLAETMLADGRTPAEPAAEKVTPAPEAVTTPTGPPADPRLALLAAHEQARHDEGQAMLEAMRRDLPGLFAQADAAGDAA
jgi:hypothetical protein